MPVAGWVSCGVANEGYCALAVSVVTEADVVVNTAGTTTPVPTVENDAAPMPLFIASR